jgi:hypothetical protein
MKRNTKRIKKKIFEKLIIETIDKNRDKIKTYLEIGALFAPMVIFVLSFFERINFSMYYKVSKIHRELDPYFLLEKIAIILYMGYTYFFLQKTQKYVSKSNLKKILRKIKRIVLKKEGIEKITIVLIRIAYILLFISFVFIVALLLYSIIFNFLTFYDSEETRNTILSFSKDFYSSVFWGIVFFCLITFLMNKSSKISQLINILLIIFIIFYGLKDITNESYWKREYEIILKDKNIVKVVLARKGEKLFIADGIIEKDGKFENLKIDTTSCKSIDESGIPLQYKVFNRIIINENQKEKVEEVKELKVKIDEKIISFKLDRMYLKEVHLNFTTSKFYIGEFKSEKVYGDFKEYLIDEQIFQMIREDYPNIKTYKIESF